ncbi:MAG: peroxiredoxin family protein [Halobacteriales archaeon]|nr:peroxiredoxin family protein [Halobacteriales archaeon]
MAELPKVGARFPSITLHTKGNAPVRIPEDYRGKTVVLSWYPYAFSPVCTEEFEGFTRVAREFQHLNAHVVGASCDHWYTTEAYKHSLGAPFPFLSDWSKEASRAVGVLEEKLGRPDRVIQVIDGEGVLRWQKHYETKHCPQADEFLGELKKLA